MKQILVIVTMQKKKQMMCVAGGDSIASYRGSELMRRRKPMARDRRSRQRKAGQANCAFPPSTSHIPAWESLDQHPP